MNGSTVDFGNEFTYQNKPVDLGPSSPWSVAGLGDFNGDGMADILLRNTNGDARRLDHERLDNRVRERFDLSRQDSRSRPCMERRGNRRLQRRQQIGHSSPQQQWDARGLVHERVDDQFRPGHSLIRARRLRFLPLGASPASAISMATEWRISCCATPMARLRNGS